MADSPVPTTVEDVEALIREVEQYRERLVNDTIATARKAKLPKSAVMAQLEPQLARLDSELAGLRQRQSELSDASGQASTQEGTT